MSDALRYTYDDITARAIEAVEAGALILLLHTRDNKTGAPSVNHDDNSPFLGCIKQASDVVMNIFNRSIAHTVHSRPDQARSHVQRRNAPHEHGVDEFQL